MATHSGILAWSIPVDRGAWGGAGYSSWGRRESDTTEATVPMGTVTVLRCPSLHHPSTETHSGRWGATHVVSPGSPLCCDACLLRPAPHPHPFFRDPPARACRHRTIYCGLRASCVSPPLRPHARTKTPVKSKPLDQHLETSRGMFDGRQKGATGFFCVSDFPFTEPKGSLGSVWPGH